ncbi:MAG: hypothetical protein ACW99A_01240 [Candidatus Kariarchaeaceae archaeon]|jgi:hypothetical protein
MGLGKVILGIFGILMLLVAVVVVDGYLTYQTFNDLNSDEIADLVSDPVFTVSGTNSDVITMSVNVDLPSAGFIPKGVLIKLIVDFNGDIQSDEETVDLGESKTLSIQFTMNTANANTLAADGTLAVSADAEVTPQVFGYSISQAKQDIDLGDFSVSK